MEQGQVLLLDGHPMQSLPYFVAAKTEGIENPALRLLLVQASRTMPLVDLLGMLGITIPNSSSGNYRISAAGGDTTATETSAALFLTAVETMELGGKEMPATARPK